MNYIKLTYFKTSGKYYSEGEYSTTTQDLTKIWEEVEYLKNSGALPGLINGAREFIVLVDVPTHPFNHPHLIL